MCAARTLRDHLVDGGASLVRHETDDGVNDEASKDARAAVDHGHNQSVPETPSKCLFVFFLFTGPFNNCGHVGSRNGIQLHYV